MIDINNRNVNELSPEDVQILNSLVAKYNDVLLQLSDKQKPFAHFIAFLIEVASLYIKEKHTTLTPDWKTWCIIYLKELYINNQIENNDYILAHIDLFVEHYNKNYQKFIDDIGISASDYDRDYEFVIKFAHKKNR